MSVPPTWGVDAVAGKDLPHLDCCGADIEVFSPAGEHVASLCASQEEALEAVKRRLQRSCGVPLFAQRLLPLGGPALELCDMTALGDLPVPRRLTLVVLPFQTGAGASLLEQAWHGRLQGVVEALRSPADPNFNDAHGETALFKASANGHLEVVHTLCTAGADKDKAAASGATPLIMASQEGHLDVVRMLCDVGANLNQEAAHGVTALHVAADEGHADILRILCDAGADINKAAAHGATPLLMACFAGHLAAVHALCEVGADRQQAGSNGITPLVLAALEGHAEVVRVLCIARAGRQSVAASGTAPLRRPPCSGLLRIRMPCKTGKARARRSAGSIVQLSAVRKRRLKVSLLWRCPRPRSGAGPWGALPCGISGWLPPGALQALRHLGSRQHRGRGKAAVISGPLPGRRPQEPP